MKDLMKIVLAEDDLGTREALIYALGIFGFEIVSTDNGSEALTIIREKKPDLVLLDIMMPGMTGDEVCRAVKDDKELQHIPVLLLTASHDDKTLDCVAKKAGADSCMTKPFTLKELRTKVEQLIPKERTEVPGE